MTKRRNVLIPLLAGAALLLGAHAALAGTNLRDIRTTDANPGGKGYFLHRGGKLVLGACDIQPDGHGVNTYASYVSGFQPLVRNGFVRDGDNANNGPCHEQVIQAKAGRIIYVMVCLQDRGAGEKPHFCRIETARA
jgi:hypothetical protein